jgi:hypothetical protein
MYIYFKLLYTYGDKMSGAKTVQLEAGRKAIFWKPKIIGMRKLVCSNETVHNVKVIKYDDESVWVACPLFGWYINDRNTPELGCANRKKRCTWYLSTH